MVVHGPDTGDKPLISGLAGGATVRVGQPGIERRTRDLDDRAQPHHLKGVQVVGNELEAAHQFISPAKYLAADHSYVTGALKAGINPKVISDRIGHATLDSSCRPMPMSYETATETPPSGQPHSLSATAGIRPTKAGS
jgi:hypothetical protein